MKKLFFATVVMLLSFSAFAQNTSALLNDYIKVKDALVNGDGKTAAQAVNALHQSLKNEGSFAQKDALLKATDKLSKAGTIEKQRAAFNDVSTNMWQLVKKSDKVGHAIHYQYCPMKKHIG
ncbi:DUF3347 domain-containing protein [Niabella hibiscisoli]|uniref:DUF3347 domain-containing protein n=1 Tax=Niabella hibiscisoli TaxID=1825928 RepID=UPI001F0E96C2|nr:DUF3347 domain-containing protein [Niabella hibiscisoli]MCH5716385.1 DUF3347 domain-containing protein [Niabella hibiscisoli]